MIQVLRRNWLIEAVLTSQLRHPRIHMILDKAKLKLTLAIRAASLLDNRDRIIDLHSSGRVSHKFTPP